MHLGSSKGFRAAYTIGSNPEAISYLQFAGGKVREVGAPPGITAFHLSYWTWMETVFVVCPSTVQLTATVPAPRRVAGNAMLIWSNPG